ncbi:hypothetical protein HBB16_02660 [Pseudonocardia sp. MCCB 268]|nr:hypothetical protein [Pseudonocardia cytotoxica]
MLDERRRLGLATGTRMWDGGAARGSTPAGGPHQRISTELTLWSSGPLAKRRGLVHTWRPYCSVPPTTTASRTSSALPPRRDLRARRRGSGAGRRGQSAGTRPPTDRFIPRSGVRGCSSYAVTGPSKVQTVGGRLLPVQTTAGALGLGAALGVGCAPARCPAAQLGRRLRSGPGAARPVRAGEYAGEHE